VSKVKKNDVEYDAQGVALSVPYPSAAEAPGGPEPARATFASPGDAGVSGPVDTSCSGCGEPCDDDFCFCHPTCDTCDDDSYVDFALEQFTFTITPEDLPCGDYQDCHSPDTYMAFWEDGDDPALIVADTLSDARWRVIRHERQQRAASRPFYTWFCERLDAPSDPCDDDFLRSISS
jgi:hypothetical protein